VRFGIWTSGLGPAPAAIAAIRARGLDLAYVRTPEEPVPAIPVDWVLLLSYPRLVGREALDLQPMLNCHNALLPRYRGLHAFTWALIHGEERLGYTLHRVEVGADTGAILRQCPFDVTPDEDINDVFRKAGTLLPPWIAESLALFDQGLLAFTPQEESLATRFPRRREEDGLLRWDQSARAVHDFVRAQAPPYAPGAFIPMAGSRLVVARTLLAAEPATRALPGTVVEVAETGFKVQCADMPLQVTSAWILHPDGRREAFTGIKNHMISRCP